MEFKPSIEHIKQIWNELSTELKDKFLEGKRLNEMALEHLLQNLEQQWRTQEGKGCEIHLEADA